MIPQSHHLARTQLLNVPVEVPRGLATPARPGLRSIGERLGELGIGDTWPVGERFAVGPALGAGASAAVVAARDRDLDREVALKVIGEHGARDAAAVKRLIEEARLTASLAHPNVLPVYDLGVDADGRTWFAMKRVDGGSLADAIESSRMGVRDPAIADPAAIAAVFIAVCQALAFAHHRDVVHQDVKPANIMLGGFGEVLLVDWGSAARAPVTAGGRLYGTPLYMSPEQARREYADARSDVYCAGATLFHALTLRLPTWHDDEAGFWKLKCAGNIALPTLAERMAMPAPLLAIALKALAADPSARYQSAESMLADLVGWRDGLAIAAFPEAPWWPALRWCRRNRRIAAAAAAALLAVAAFAIAWSAEKAKEVAAWRLVYEADLAGKGLAALAGRWHGRRSVHESPFSDLDLADGWSVADGALACSPDQREVRDLTFDRGFFGDVRVEWVVTSDADIPGNLNCYFGGDDRFAGYACHVGGWDDPGYSAITRGVHYDPCDNRAGERLRSGRPYRMRFEREGAVLRLSVDGAVALEFAGATELEGAGAQSFGLDAGYGKPWRISSIRIWERPLAERVSPLVIGDRAAQTGDYERAAREYGLIAQAYPGRALGITAAFKAGMSTVRAGHGDDGFAMLDALEHEHPDHDLVPDAIALRLADARARRDRPGIEAQIARLATHPGHPALRAAVYALMRDAIAHLRDPSLDHDSLPATARSELADLKRRSALLAPDVSLRRYLQEVNFLLIVSGFPDGSGQPPP